MDVQNNTYCYLLGGVDDGERTMAVCPPSS